MHPFPRKCEVCYEWCNSKREWITHFFNLTHTNKVAEKGSQLWNKNWVRNCSILITGQFDLEWRAVLEYLMKEPRRRFVVNFKSKLKKPHVGVVQLDRRLAFELHLTFFIGGNRINRNYQCRFIVVLQLISSTTDARGPRVECLDWGWQNEAQESCGRNGHWM